MFDKRETNDPVSKIPKKRVVLLDVSDQKDGF